MFALRPASLCLLSVLTCGCSSNESPHDVANREQRNATNVSETVSGSTNDATVQEGANAGNESQAEEGIVPGKPAGSFIGELRDLVGSSPVFKEHQDLQSGLQEADQLLSEIKQENLEALRDASRQPIIEPRPPNIVLVLADDLGLGDVGCYGQRVAATPHLDKLASEGVRFSHFYAGGPTSADSWWSLMTGLYTARLGRKNDSPVGISPQLITLPEVMWRAGFDTGFVGNWSLVHREADMPHLHGFDEWQGTRFGEEIQDFPEYVWSNGAKARIKGNHNGEGVVSVHEYFQQETRAFLNHHRDGRPFFLVVALTLPRGHGRQPLESYASQDWPLSTKQHASAISRLDESVGEILDELEQIGLHQNTVVFFTSDNAPRAKEEAGHKVLNSTGGLRGAKGDLYEGGIRVPFIARWPGVISAGSATDFPSAVWDLLPTCAEIGRVSPKRTDGVSLFPVFRGASPKNRERFYWESHSGGLAQAVRLGPWKAVRPAGKMSSDAIELYNLDTDPLEGRNVAAERQDIVAKLIQGNTTSDP